MSDARYLAIGIPGGEFITSDGRRMGQVITHHDHWEMSTAEYRVWCDSLTGQISVDPHQLSQASSFQAENREALQSAGYSDPYALLHAMEQIPLVFSYYPDVPNTDLIDTLTIVPNGTLIGNVPDNPQDYLLATPDGYPYHHHAIDITIWVACWNHQTISTIITEVAKHTQRNIEKATVTVWRFIETAMAQRLIYLAPGKRRLSS